MPDDSSSLDTKGLRRLKSDILTATRRMQGPAGISAMNRALNVVEPLMIRNIRSALKTRSGTLVKSVRREVTRDRQGLPVGKVGPSAIYAAIHELGGTIRPRRARHLAIPLPPAKTGAGVARGGPRDYPDLFLIKGRTGRPILVRDIGGGRLRAFFVLQNRVRIKKRPYAKPTAERSADQVARILGDAFMVGFKRGRRS